MNTYRYDELTVVGCRGFSQADAGRGQGIMARPENVLSIHSIDLFSYFVAKHITKGLITINFTMS